MREELTLFAHNLQVYMDMYGYSQASLSDSVGVGHTTVNDWCHGRKFPRIGTLDKLCELFHCKRSDLIEKYTTAETIKANALETELHEYMSKLNPEGMEHMLRYFKDLNPKFFKGEEDVQ